MPPSKCPSEDALARLAAGTLSDVRRDKLVSHLLRCDRCRLIAQDFENIKLLLSCSRIDESGKLVIEQPRLSERPRVELKNTVLQEFRRKLAREKRLLALIEEAAEEFGAAEGEEVQQPATVGYYARRPGEEAEELYSNLMRLLSILLDPSLPADKRASWAEETVRQLKKRLDDSVAAANS